MKPRTLPVAKTIPERIRAARERWRTLAAGQGPRIADGAPRAPIAERRALRRPGGPRSEAVGPGAERAGAKALPPVPDAAVVALTRMGFGQSPQAVAGMFADLAAGLHPLYTELDGAGPASYTDRLTLVVQSEFGRELFQNHEEGTEHGYGNPMLVLSGNAIGGLHGSWPGLHVDQLQDGTDLAVTTDYRRVLSEILIRRMCNVEIDTIFPGYRGYAPLGIVQGPDLQPQAVFSDGFESGAVDRWSTSTGV